MRLHVCGSLYCASFYGFSYTYLIALTIVLLFLLLLLCMILFQVSSQVIIILYKLLLTVVVACRAAGSPIFVLHFARASVFPSDRLFVCLLVGWLVGWLVGCLPSVLCSCKFLLRWSTRPSTRANPAAAFYTRPSTSANPTGAFYTGPSTRGNPAAAFCTPATSASRQSESSQSVAPPPPARPVDNLRALQNRPSIFATPMSYLDKGKGKLDIELCELEVAEQLLNLRYLPMHPSNIASSSR